MTGGAIAIDEVLCISQQLSLADRLSLVSLLSEQIRRELGWDGEAVDMLSLAGLGAELWREVDVDTYLEQERASWDN